MAEVQDQQTTLVQLFGKARFDVDIGLLRRQRAQKGWKELSVEEDGMLVSGSSIKKTACSKSSAII